MQPPPPQLPLTTRRQIGTYGALSFLSLSYPSYHMGFSFSLFSAVFFCPIHSLLSLSLVYLPESFGPKTKNETLRALDDKQTREEEEEEEEKKGEKEKNN